MTRYAALYCRLSPRPDGSYEGVEAQEQWGRDYAASAWPALPVMVFLDAGISAANGDHRPQYERLRQAVRDGMVACLWVVEQSRLERREVQWFELAAELDAAGISEIHTNRDGIVRVRDDVAGIKAVLNAGEVRKLKARVNDRLATLAAEGRPPGARPFGYRHTVDGEGAKRYEIVPEQAAAIRQAAEWVLSGWALSNIVAELRKQGLRGAHGGEISTGSVRSMLTNPTVAGNRVHQGRIVGRGQWEPILDEDTWQAVKHRLSTPRVVHRRDGSEHPVSAAHVGNPAGRLYLLTGGLAVCGVCGAPLVGSKKQLKRRADGSRPVVPYLQCHPNRGGKGCVGIMLEPTDEHVLDTLFTELDKPEFLDALAVDEHAQRRREITDALGAVDRQRGDLAALWATPGELSDTEWKAARRALAENEQRLRAELAELPPPVVKLDIAGAREAWPSMTLDERREFVRLFLERVVIHPASGPRRFNAGRVEIEWRQR